MTVQVQACVPDCVIVARSTLSAGVARQRKYVDGERRAVTALAALPLGSEAPVFVTELTKENLPHVDRLNRKGLPIAYSEGFYQQVLESAAWTKVALWQDVVVGAAICQVSEESADCLHLQTLVAAVPRRRIGSQLLEAIQAQASEFGFSGISLCVHVRNARAIAFYKSLGYRVLERRVGYYSLSEGKLEAPLDAFFMLRELGQLPVEDTLPAPLGGGATALPSSASQTSHRMDCKALEERADRGHGPKRHRALYVGGVCQEVYKPSLATAPRNGPWN